METGGTADSSNSGAMIGGTMSSSMYKNGGRVGDIMVGDKVKIKSGYSNHDDKNAEVVRVMPDNKTLELKIKHKAGNEYVKFEKSEVEKYAKGGNLKPIPKGNKGLPKLPESVRNKMGYMAKGGGVLSVYEIKFKNAKGETEYTRTEAYNKAEAMKVGKFFETHPSQFMRGGFKVVEVNEVTEDGSMAKGGRMDDYTKTMGMVEVIFENPKYNYETSISGDVTELEARKYFVGQMFDVGVYPKENMQRAIDIKFYPKGSYAKGGGVKSFKKGDKVKTREGKIETVIRKNKNGNYETQESDYTWNPSDLTLVSKMEWGGTAESSETGEFIGGENQSSMYARGGHVSKGEMVWKKLSSSDKIKFLHENFTPEITPRSQEILVGKAWNFLPKNVKIKFQAKYANVENYGEGGGTGVSSESGTPIGGENESSSFENGGFLSGFTYDIGGL